MHSSPLRRVALTLVIALASAEVRAEGFRFERFGAEDGLASSQIYAIDQDERGFLWLATAEGLSRFDGVEFRNFDVSTGLHDQRLISMTRDAAGRLWLGTEQSVAVYDGRTVKSFTAEDGLGAGTIWSLDVDARGRVWAGTQAGGVSVIDGDAVTTFTTEDGLPSNFVVRVLADSRGRVWLSTRQDGFALVSLDGAELVIEKQWGPGDGLVRSPTSFVEEPDGAIVVGTWGGVFRINDSLQLERIRTGIMGNVIFSMLRDREGRLVAATLDTGVSICSPPAYESCLHLQRRLGLPVNTVTTAFEDREGVLWVGTASGLLRWPGGRFVNYDETDGLPPTTHVSVAPDSGGAVWIASLGGVTRLDPGGPGRPPSTRTITPRDGLPMGNVFHALRDREGRVWFGTGGGLCLWRDERCLTFTIRNGLPNDQIQHLFESREGSIWVGTRHGAARLTGLSDDGGATFEPLPGDGLPGGDVHSIAEDRDGAIWLAMSGGVARVDGNSIRVFTTKDGLGSNTANDVLVARDGAVWVATSGAGVARYDPATESFRAHGVESGLPYNSVRSMIEDGDGTLWLATPAGVVHADPGRVGQAGFVIAHYTIEDGLASHEAFGSRALARTDNGELWFCFSDGVTRVLNGAAAPSSGPPDVHIESVDAGGHVLYEAPFAGMRRDGTPTPENPTASSRDLTFEYRAISFRNRRSVAYRVFLEGYDHGWSEQGARRSKEYTQLPPGRYVFHVQAKIGGGEWGEPARREVEIPARFRETRAFMLLVVIAGGLVILAAHKLRLRSVRARNAELAAIVDERTRDLAGAIDELRDANIALETVNEIVKDADRAKSRFLANMSHELRTPMNSIIGFTELLLARSRPIPEEKQVRFLTNVMNSAKTLLGLINDVLDISKVEAGRMEVNVESVSLASLLESAIETLRSIASQKRVELRGAVEPALGIVRVDGAKVRQIVLNLCSNAIKFSPPDSVVDVTIANGSGVTFEIRVRDRGPGIPSDQLNELFSEYKQARATSRLGLGTGLGLALVKNFAELQGGSVGVESVVGEGSTFRVSIPLDASRWDTEGGGEGSA